MYKNNLILSILLFIALQSYSINPEREYKMTPDKFKIEHQEEKIKSTDGANLNTWIMKSPVEEKKDYVFIIVGSDAGNMGYSLPYAAYLLRQGFDVITFDYRGFGQSSDFEHHPDNLYHSEYIDDFQSVVTWTKKQSPDKKIGILSFSMGTLVSIKGYKDAKYDAFVGEGFIRCPEKTVERIKELKGKDVLLPKDHKSDESQTKKIKIPMLLFASKTDQVTPLEDSLKVASLRKNRKVIEFEGEHLRGAMTLGIPNYVAEIEKMILSESN